tara:strand:- start:355 stop:489 length:135 start_codon:yes stop_codon:yes gene_type:complete
MKTQTIAIEVSSTGNLSEAYTIRAIKIMINVIHISIFIEIFSIN